MQRLSLILFALAVMRPGLSADEPVQPAIDVRFSAGDLQEIPDFQKHIVPMLGRLGCNGRNCHGSFQGRGGFSLSLFGYDFEMDHAGMIGKPSSGGNSRINREHPDQSLLVQKPLLGVDHEGGQRFDVESWEHRALRSWIAGGAPEIATPRELSKLIVKPSEVVFQDDGNDIPLRVIAVWEDGYREDVTPLCRFRSNDDSIAEVDQDGRVSSLAPGDSHVIAFYDNGVVAVPVMRKFSHESFVATPVNRAVGIDSFVLGKLNKLGIQPSKLCDDAVFLRRLSLDLTGTLPTPAEVDSFSADTADDKRMHKINELLERPAYAAWWANKLCDFTGCNPRQQAEVGQETSVQWYGWIYQRLRENTPYDELIRRIVLAGSRQQNQSYAAYAAETSAYFRAESPRPFAQRETMPHYWTRRSMQEPDQAAEAFAHNFLGIRLQCAQCHKHPFAPWTQHDYRQFSQFFESVKFGVASENRDAYQRLAKQVGLTAKEEGTAIRSDMLRKAQMGHTIPWRELYIARRDNPVSLSLLRSERVELSENDDPRLPIMAWMADSSNPWFARAIVNRVWAAYFHIALVDPPDDLSPANPPSNPQLLDWLTQQFVEHDFDLKWLQRQIVSSQTYQRSWKPNETNQDDRRNYSRSVPRRMPAEVVYDSVKQAVAGTGQLDDVRLDLSRRAIGHLSMRLAGTYAMDVFGKPDRAVNCDCERVNQPTLLQSVFMQNDPIIDQRLQDSGWLREIERQEADGQPLDHQQLVNSAWLRTLSRRPTVAESARAMQQISRTSSATEGLRDLMWALLNTKEFILIQ